VVATVAAVSQFDQAYRDNRQGFVIIADDLAREHEIELLKERIEIVKIEPDPIADASRCYGYSIDFEPLILGAVHGDFPQAGQPLARSNRLDRAAELTDRRSWWRRWFR